MRKLIIFIAIILIGVLAFFYFRNDKTIDDLEAYFKNSGFSVNKVYQSQKEKDFIEGFKDIMVKLGADEKSVVESELKSINNIEVQFTRYKNSKLAQENYQRQVDTKARSKKKAEQNNEDYFHTSYYINDVFVLTVHHFDVSLSFKSESIDIPKDELNKIVATFQKF